MMLYSLPFEERYVMLCLYRLNQYWDNDIDQKKNEEITPHSFFMLSFIKGGKYGWIIRLCL